MGRKFVRLTILGSMTTQTRTFSTTTWLCWAPCRINTFSIKSKRRTCCIGSKKLWMITWVALLRMARDQRKIKRKRKAKKKRNLHPKVAKLKGPQRSLSLRRKQKAKERERQKSHRQ